MQLFLITTVNYYYWIKHWMSRLSTASKQILFDGIININTHDFDILLD